MATKLAATKQQDSCVSVHQSGRGTLLSAAIDKTASDAPCVGVHPDCKNKTTRLVPIKLQFKSI